MNHQMNPDATINRTHSAPLASDLSGSPANPAPLRFEGSGQYDATPAELFEMVSDATKLHRWLPMIKKVRMDHSKAECSGELGAGSVRTCSFRGMGNVEEGIFWWNPPQGYGFRFTPQGRARLSTPTSNHVVYFLVDSDGGTGSRLTIRVHFDWRGTFMRHIAAHVMPMTLDRALANLRRELGGKGGTMKRVA